MRALRFHNSMPRIIASKILGQLSSRAFVAPFAPIKMDELPEPPLPRPDWVRLRMQVAGICGSDLKQVVLNGAWDNPMTALISFPHVLGHEAVGVVTEVGPQVTTRKVGDRVLLDPWLGCKTRGIDPPCAPCSRGDHTVCRNFDAGALPPGIHLGNNAAAPGAFAETFVAHESMCFPLPDGVSDEQAVLGDPFSVSLHSILRAPPPDDAPALIYGAGTLGLTALAGLRKLYPRTPVYVVARYPHQAELARKFGATEVLPEDPRTIIERVAELTGAKTLKPWHGLPWLLDGVGVVYDTVGYPQTVETGIRITRSRGTVVVSGVEMPKRFEWTPIYFKEVSVTGSNAFAFENFRGSRQHAMSIYLDLLSEGLDCTPIITHRFTFNEWRTAFRALMNRKTSGAVKVLLRNA